MKGKSMKQLLVMMTMVVAAFLFVQDAQAQSFTPGDAALVGPKSTLFKNKVFKTNNEATLDLKAEIQNILSTTQANGGSTEAVASVKVEFYSAILDDVQTGDTVEDAIKDNYSVVLGATNRFAVPVNSQAILEGAITLLTL